jgi:hypothetical protein
MLASSANQLTLCNNEKEGKLYWCLCSNHRRRSTGGVPPLIIIS